MSEHSRLNRRSLVKLAALGSVASGAVAASLRSAVAQEAPAAAPFEGSLYFTEANPGRWSKKVKGHLPTIKVKKMDEGLSIGVVTAHEMKGFEHYIVKHILIDDNFKVLGEKLFNPVQEFQAKSTFELTGEPYKGKKLYAVSVCNKHDAWLNSVEID